MWGKGDLQAQSRGQTLRVVPIPRLWARSARAPPERSSCARHRARARRSARVRPPMRAPLRRRMVWAPLGRRFASWGVCRLERRSSAAPALAPVVPLAPLVRPPGAPHRRRSRGALGPARGSPSLGCWEDAPARDRSGSELVVVGRTIPARTPRTQRRSRRCL